MAGKYRHIKGKTEKNSENPLDSYKIHEDPNINLDNLNAVFRECSDFSTRLFTAGGTVKLLAVFMDSLVDKDVIYDSIIKPLISMDKAQLGQELDSDPIPSIAENIVYSSTVKVVNSFKDAVNDVLDSSCVLFAEGSVNALSISADENKGRTVSANINEAVVMGPHEAFVESLEVNVALLRNKLKTPDYKMEKLTLGRLGRTNAMLMYIKGLANDSVVAELKNRLDSVDIDVVTDSTYIVEFIKDSTLSPFPQIIVTERPDRTILGLAEGRLALLVDGSPNGLVMPAVFGDFITSPEDLYTKFYFSTLIRIVRYTAMFIALLGPALYIAITTYHQEMIPLPLLITLSRSRADMPFPAVIEALLAELVFELLREAGIRIPQPVGPAVSIVGGLVIGQGVVSAGLFSQIIVIVVAVTGIASFAIPKYNFAITLRFLRFILIIVASFLGIYGLIMGLMVLAVHLCSLRSLGVPYMSPFTPLSFKDLKELIIAVPQWARLERPSFIQKENPKRMKSGQKPAPGKKGGG